MRLLRLMSLGIVVLLDGGADAVEPPPPAQQNNFISRAVFAEGRLWLLTDAGELSTIVPAGKKRVSARLPDPVLDICASDGVVQALTCPRDACTSWTLRRRHDGAWTTAATIRTEGDNLAAISCASPGVTTVLTDRRLIEVVGGNVSSLALSTKLETSEVTSIHVTSNHVFAGINAGEWGGGLRRIDRKTGKVSVIEKTTGGLCEGPLNTSCDPVTAIADEPWKPGCVAAAIGLVHFSPHGRIVEICRNTIRSVYSRTIDGGQPFETEAFFGLVRTGKELVGVGIDGLYRFSSSKAPTRVKLPAFESVGNVSVSFAFPDVVLVVTGINQRRSMSGNVPLVVPR